MKRNQVLWGGAGVIVAAVIIFFAFFSSYPPDKDMQGAIGVAKQYRAEQITDADVVLQDPEIQDLLQSDFFYKLVTDDAFRKVAVGQLARLDLATSRHAQVADFTSLADMKVFLDYAAGNREMKQALADGKMDVVRKVLIKDGRQDLDNTAKRIYFTLGSDAKVNFASLTSMKVFLDYAAGNRDMKRALADGKIDVAKKVLIKDGKKEYADAAQKVMLAEGRHAQVDFANLADMKVFLDYAAGNREMKQALADGKMDVVRKVLIKDGRQDLDNTAKRIYFTLGSDAKVNFASLTSMKVFLDYAAGNRDMKRALADGKIDVAKKVLIKDGKKEYADAAQKVMLAEGRHAQVDFANLADMKVFLDYAAGNREMKQALADGKMDVVRKVLIKDGRQDLDNTAKRIYFTQGSDSKVNFASLTDMKVFLDYAAGNRDMKQALADGKIDVANKVLIKDGKGNLNDAAQKVFLAEGRHAQVDFANLADMKVFLDYAAGNREMKQALADGKMDVVRKVLIKDGRQDLDNTAKRIYFTQGSDSKVNFASLTDMKVFLDYAAGNRDMKQALADGKIDVANKVLIKDGKGNLNDAAQKVFLAEGRHAQVDFANLADMKVFLDYAAGNREMKQALADGKMDVVNKVLIKDGRQDLANTAKRIYFTQGSDAKVNLASLADMKVFLDYAAGNRDMKQALADGKIDVANKVLIKDGKGNLNDAAQKVFLAEGRHAQVNVINHADMRVIASFASENGDFARAMRDGKLDMAAKIALTSGKNDISLYNLKSATYILGNNKNFASDLNRVAAVVAMPTYRVAVDHPGWSRLISISNEASWKQTVNAVKDGKVQLQ